MIWNALYLRLYLSLVINVIIKLKTAKTITIKQKWTKWFSEPFRVFGSSAKNLDWVLPSSYVKAKWSFQPIGELKLLKSQVDLMLVSDMIWFNVQYRKWEQLLEIISNIPRAWSNQNEMQTHQTRGRNTAPGRTWRIPRLRPLQISSGPLCH